MNQNNTVCKNKDRNEDFRKLVQVQNSDHNTIKLVHMIIRDDHDLLSDFYSNKPVISSEAASFLENGIKPLNLKKDSQLIIEISSEHLSHFQKQICTEAIHNYYENLQIENRVHLKWNTTTSIVLFLIGAAILAVMVILQSIGMKPYLSEIFDIVGWVFVWQATDQYFLERYDLKMNDRYWNALTNAKIHFVPFDHQENRIVKSSKSL